MHELVRRKAQHLPLLSCLHSPKMVMTGRSHFDVGMPIRPQMSPVPIEADIDAALALRA